MSTMGLLSSGLGSSFTTSSYVGTSSPIPSTPWEEGGREGRGGRGRGKGRGRGEGREWKKEDRKRLSSSALRAVAVCKDGSLAGGTC